MKTTSTACWPYWRCIVSLWLLVFTVMGCVAMDSRVDHTIQIFNAGKAEVVNLTYTYSDLGPRDMRVLGVGGDAVTRSMLIPEFIDVKWTTAADGKKHEAHVPLKSKVSSLAVSGNTISVEIDGSILKVFLVKRLPDFKRERKQLY